MGKPTNFTYNEIFCSAEFVLCADEIPPAAPFGFDRLRMTRRVTASFSSGGARSRLSPRSVLLLRIGVHRTPAPLPYKGSRKVIFKFAISHGCRIYLRFRYPSAFPRRAAAPIRELNFTKTQACKPDHKISVSVSLPLGEGGPRGGG